jgi:NAD(P)-dependent dehydrogenase (short-subunit alcohol dehydrogenase family)|tara:strand:+ start:82 stop:900 length:819 start_codon:yes stop_codon:yes gene_type:complete
MKNLFDLQKKTALITGGAGLLGPKHAEAILEHGGNCVLADWHLEKAQNKAEELNSKFGEGRVKAVHMNVADKNSVTEAVNQIGLIDILINNAAKDPKVKKDSNLGPESRFENMTEEYWRSGIDAIINGTFFVTQAVCNKMIFQKTKGVVLNISSDLGVIAPDQRLYEQEGLEDDQQNVKPITYSAAKWSVIGMTKYLAVYFAKKNIRVNCLSPTGVFNNHPDDFVKKLSNIIPMGRMSDINEYKGAIVFMCSEASSYMTGENIVIDGGKTVW